MMNDYSLLIVQFVE